VQSLNVGVSNIHTSTPTINAIRTPVVHTPTIHTPTVSLGTSTIRTSTVNIKVPTVRVPTVRVPTVRVPTVNVRIPTITVRVPTVSDIRLKRDISEVAELPNGLHLYRYRYAWSDVVYVGVMAQEVAPIAPSAVIRGADGYLRVDYDRLGLRLLTWDEWAGRCGESCRHAR
jgi:hypothetical protein